RIATATGGVETYLAAGGQLGEELPHRVLILAAAGGHRVVMVTTKFTKCFGRVPCGEGSPGVLEGNHTIGSAVQHKHRHMNPCKFLAIRVMGTKKPTDW